MNETFPPRLRFKWLFITVRLSIINFAGTARTLVAVGTVNEASMLCTTRALTPRIGSRVDAPGLTKVGIGLAIGSAGVATLVGVACATGATGVACATGAAGVAEVGVEVEVHGGGAAKGKEQGQAGIWGRCRTRRSDWSSSSCTRPNTWQSEHSQGVLVPVGRHQKAQGRGKPPSQCLPHTPSSVRAAAPGRPGPHEVGACRGGSA